MRGTALGTTTELKLGQDKKYTKELGPDGNLTFLDFSVQVNYESTEVVSEHRTCSRASCNLRSKGASFVLKNDFNQEAERLLLQSLNTIFKEVSASIPQHKWTLQLPYQLTLIYKLFCILFILKIMCFFKLKTKVFLTTTMEIHECELLSLITNLKKPSVLSSVLSDSYK